MRRSVIILGVLIALFATACGGEGDTTDTTADAVDDVVDAAGDAADDAGAAAGAIDSEACTEAAEALTAVPQSITTALTGQIDVEEVRGQARAIADLDVPEEFQADFQIIADTYTQIASTLDGITLEPGAIPDADTQAALTELGTSLSDTGYITASTNLSGYFAGGCQ